MSSRTNINRELHYTPNPRLKALALIATLFALLLGYEVWRSATIEPAVFFVGACVIALGLTMATMARLTLTANQLVWQVPLWRHDIIELRQLFDVQSVGRGSRSLLLCYYLLDDDGNLDYSQPRFLNLLPLQEQSDLHAKLETAVDQHGAIAP